jgi:hypothetical protein
MASMLPLLPLFLPALASVQRDEKTAVTCRVVGILPGSPVDLQFVFSLEGGKIASLEIS